LRKALENSPAQLGEFFDHEENTLLDRIAPNNPLFLQGAACYSRLASW
jgi:hypothetical protein